MLLSAYYKQQKKYSSFPSVEATANALFLSEPTAAANALSFPEPTAAANARFCANLQKRENESLTFAILVQTNAAKNVSS